MNKRLGANIAHRGNHIRKFSKGLSSDIKTYYPHSKHGILKKHAFFGDIWQRRYKKKYWYTNLWTTNLCTVYIFNIFNISKAFSHRSAAYIFTASTLSDTNIHFVLEGSNVLAQNIRRKCR